MLSTIANDTRNHTKESLRTKGPSPSAHESSDEDDDVVMAPIETARNANDASVSEIPYKNEPYIARLANSESVVALGFHGPRDQSSYILSKD
jgi:hypothetical protein